jgi:hypothetical protein
MMASPPPKKMRLSSLSHRNVARGRGHEMVKDGGTGFTPSLATSADISGVTFMAIEVVVRPTRSSSHKSEPAGFVTAFGTAGGVSASVFSRSVGASTVGPSESSFNSAS